MGFFRQEDWSGLPFPSPGDRPDPGIKLTSPKSPELQADSSLLSHWGSPHQTLAGYKSTPRGSSVPSFLAEPPSWCALWPASTAPSAPQPCSPQPCAPPAALRPVRVGVWYVCGGSAPSWGLCLAEIASARPAPTSGPLCSDRMRSAWGRPGQPTAPISPDLGSPLLSLSVSDQSFLFFSLRDSQPLFFYIYTSVSLSILLSVFLSPYLSFLSPYPDPGSSASAASVSGSLSPCFPLCLSRPPSSPPALIFLRLLSSKSPCRQPGHSLGRTCWGISESPMGSRPVISWK